jgi:PKD repeat protein
MLMQSWVSHTYAKPGIYDVSLNVTHNNTISNYTSISRIFGTHGGTRTIAGAERNEI